MAGTTKGSLVDSTVNIPLLRKAVEWAEGKAAKPPELCEWEQQRYVVYPTEAEARENGIYGETTITRGRSPECGTCFCIAGWVAYQAAGNRDYADAFDIASTALGLDDLDAEIDGIPPHVALFSASNTIADVRRIAEEIAGERL